MKKDLEETSKVLILGPKVTYFPHFERNIHFTLKS